MSDVRKEFHSFAAQLPSLSISLVLIFSDNRRKWNSSCQKDPMSGIAEPKNALNKAQSNIFMNDKKLNRH